jgi:hypothetical protein
MWRITTVAAVPKDVLRGEVHLSARFVNHAHRSTGSFSLPLPPSLSLIIRVIFFIRSYFPLLPSASFFSSFVPFVLFVSSYIHPLSSVFISFYPCHPWFSSSSVFSSFSVPSVSSSTDWSIAVEITGNPPRKSYTEIYKGNASGNQIPTDNRLSDGRFHPDTHQLRHLVRHLESGPGSGRERHLSPGESGQFSLWA